MSTETDLMLVGDIGGTNARLRLFSVPKSAELPNNTLVGDLVLTKQYVEENASSFAGIVEMFLADVEKEKGIVAKPRVGAFAVAGPVDSNGVTFTNRSHWSHIDGHALAIQFNMERVRLVNDFVANGYGLLTLGPGETETIYDAPRRVGCPMALVGAGTGLGECFLTPSALHPDVYTCFPSEGGHTEFAPRTDLEIELLKYLRDRFKQKARVSVERICSGEGICNVYDFMAIRFPDLVKPEVDREIREAGKLAGSIIGKHYKDNSCELCKKTMEIFFSTYGSEVGCVGLKYLCYGGLYISGGIAKHYLDDLRHTTGDKSGFLDAYFDKGRVSKVLKGIPIKVVLAEDIGTRGAQLVACLQLAEVRQLEREGLGQ